MTNRKYKFCVLFLAVLTLAFVIVFVCQPDSRNLFYIRYKWKISDYFDGNNPNIVALCHAIERDDLEAVKSLIGKIDDINYLGKNNMNVLFWAMPASDEIFEALVKAGANPNITLTRSPHPYTLFGDSVMYITVADPCFLPPVNWILQEQQGKKYVFHGESQIFRLKLLLKNGGNPNLQSALMGKTLLTASCTDKRILPILLENGADPNLMDKNNNYPLDCTDGMPQQTLWLLQAGAKISVASKLNKRDPIMRYIKYKRGFLKHSKNVFRPGKDYAEECRPLDKWLLEHGVDINSFDYSLFDTYNESKLYKIFPEQRPWLIPIIDTETFRAAPMAGSDN